MNALVFLIFLIIAVQFWPVTLGLIAVAFLVYLVILLAYWVIMFATSLAELIERLIGLFRKKAR